MVEEAVEIMRLAKEMVVSETMAFAEAAEAFGVQESELRDDVLYEIVYRRMEPKNSEGYIRSVDGCRILDVDHKTLQRAVERAMIGKDIHAKRGRSFSLSPDSKKCLKESALCNISRAIGVNAVTMDDFSAAVDEIRRTTRGMNASADLKSLSHNTLSNLRSEVLPEQCKKPHQKNRRRVQAANVLHLPRGPAALSLAVQFGIATVLQRARQTTKDT